MMKPFKSILSVLAVVLLIVGLMVWNHSTITGLWARAWAQFVWALRLVWPGASDRDAALVYGGLVLGSVLLLGIAWAISRQRSARSCIKN